MKKIFLSILLICNFIYANRYDDYFSELTLKQQRFLYDIYQYSKHTKYKWTLVAISWQETLAGEALVNVFDGSGDNASCGPFHDLLSSVFSRHPEWVPSHFNKNKICTKLITDWGFALRESVAELNHWYRVRKGNWLKIWASYNSGNNYRKGMKYAYSILMKVRTLRYVVGNRWDNGFVKITIYR